jgi:RNA polymerase sigma-70 factor (ECF subfamily)
LETELLVTQFRRGKGEAFEGLVRLWERPLFYYLRRLAPTEADAWDVMQETWLRVFRAMGKIREGRAFPAFLFTTARNAAVSRLRIRGEEAREGVGESVVEEEDAVGVFDDAEEVHRGLDRLPVLQREALTLFFLEDLSLEEMAGVLGVPVGTVKSRVHYAKSALRKIILEGDRDGKR